MSFYFNWTVVYSKESHTILLSVIEDPFGLNLTFPTLYIFLNHDSDHMVVGFTTTCTCAISAYHHQSCEVEPLSWWGVLDITLCDKVCQWLATGQWFFPSTTVYSINKTDRNDISEILLKVALDTINLNLNQNHTCLNAPSNVTEVCEIKPTLPLI
jgi:hypothetical protein